MYVGVVGADEVRHALTCQAFATFALGGVAFGVLTNLACKTAGLGNAVGRRSVRPDDKIVDTIPVDVPCRGHIQGRLTAFSDPVEDKTVGPIQGG